MMSSPIGAHTRLRWLLPVIVLGLLVVVGAFVPALASGGGSESAAASTFAVYLEPASVLDADRLNLADDEVGDTLDGRDCQIVAKLEEFESLVTATHPQSVWVHADAIADVPADLTRDAMRRRAVIVGIDMPNGTLTSKLRVSGSSTPDWHLDGVVTFALYAEAQAVSDVNQQGQPSTRGKRTFGNERFDPAHPAGLLHLVSQTVARIGDMQE